MGPKFFQITCAVVLLQGVLVLLGLPLAAEDSGSVIGIKLRWEAVPGVAKYKIQLSKNKTFRNVLEQAVTREPEWTWELDAAFVSIKSEVYFRVASVTQDGIAGAFSSPQRVTIPKNLTGQSKPSRSISSTPEANSIPPAPTVESSPRWEERTQTLFHWGASINAGVGNFDQKSNAVNLKGVTGSSPFIQHRYGLFLDWMQASSTYSASGELLQSDPFEKRWSVQLQLQYLAFQGLKNPRPISQPNVGTYALDLRTLFWLQSRSEWHLGFGLVLDRSFRWVKTGSESVNSEGIFSVGPSANLVWRTSRARSFVPFEWGIALDLPVTGLMIAGQLGMEMSTWSEWAMANVLGSGVGLRLEGDLSFFTWSTPAQTQVLSWSTWGAVVFHLGSQGVLF